MITILNTSILTAHGLFEYEPISLKRAREIVQDGFLSAIGHESTARVISTLLEIDCPVNRIQYQQEPGESALVFKLRGRPEEGKVLSAGEIEEIGYEWGLLFRHSWHTLEAVIASYGSGTYL